VRYHAPGHAHGLDLCARWAWLFHCRQGVQQIYACLLASGATPRRWLPGSGAPGGRTTPRLLPTAPQCWGVLHAGPADVRRALNPLYTSRWRSCMQLLPPGMLAGCHPPLCSQLHSSPSRAGRCAGVISWQLPFFLFAPAPTTAEGQMEPAMVMLACHTPLCGWRYSVEIPAGLLNSLGPAVFV
jgi:hypothetical protein